jgi:hypothetical protein
MAIALWGLSGLNPSRTVVNLNPDLLMQASSKEQEIESESFTIILKRLGYRR